MARKAAWEDLVEADLGPYAKSRGTRWGRVFTGLLLVGCATFVAAYYLPLYRAHQKLGDQYRELGQRSQTLSESVSQTKLELKTTTEQRDQLQAERAQKESSKKASVDQLERVRVALSSKLDKFVKKGNVAVAANTGSLMVAFDSALLFVPQKVDLSPAAHTLLCDVVKTGEAKAVAVGNSLGDAGVVPPALLKSYPTPWALSAARAAAVAQALEADCSLPASQISATGNGKHDPAASLLSNAKLPLDRVELELTLR